MRFSTPRLMLTAARKLKKYARPISALLPAMSAIDSGPDMFFSDTSPMIIRPIIDTVKVTISQVLSTARGSDSTIP
jgi:hypothetical protein